MHIVLVGMPRAGKSSLGEALSRHFSFSFYDTDRMLEERMQASVAEIHKREGEEKFRILEGEVLSALTLTLPSVVSVGGGAILRKENRRRCKELGLVVYLAISPPLLWERMRKGTMPHFIRDYQTLLHLYEERTPLYREIADRCVQVDKMTLEELAEEVFYG